LFEADSCPVYEAWSEGVPVASSNHTAMPDQVGDAGLLFDAISVTAIADALQKMTMDDRLRHDLVNRGYRRVKDFDWTRTAKAYRAVYRRAAGVPLDDEDRWLCRGLDKANKSRAALYIGTVTPKPLMAIHRRPVRITFLRNLNAGLLNELRTGLSP
jgi:hypothetical protein